jgi:hypothetical protein
MTQASIPTRLGRYSDWTPLKPLCTSGSFAGKRPFYAGPNVEARMSLVRDAINHVRINWDKYPAFLLDLRSFLEAKGLDLREGGDPSRMLSGLLSGLRGWSDRRTEAASDSYNAIRLYTSDAGYRMMFSTINSAFREDGLANDVRALRCAVFLVELLNIDLFNFRGANPHADGFRGRVYRGMCVSADELAQFLMLRSAPVTERYLSTPLAMVSTSTNRERALAFALREAGRDRDRYPVLWEIHVTGMDPQSLRIYQDSFPTTVVSSICAVPIDRLSQYPFEREVLLRGPFFQLLRMRQEEGRVDGKPLHTIEAIMLHESRDHISSVSLSGFEARRARELFRILVTMERAKLCASRAEEYGLSADAQAYGTILVEQRSLLDLSIVGKS